MCNRGRHPKENDVKVIINKVDSGFRWENRYAKWLNIGFVFFVIFILLFTYGLVVVSRGDMSHGQGLFLGAGVCLTVAFLDVLYSNPWARTTKGVNRRRHTRAFALGQFWSDRGLLPYRDTETWTPRDPNVYNTGVAEMFLGLEIWGHDSTGLRVRYATYRVPNFGPRGVTAGFMGVFILSLENNWSKPPSETEILRIEELEGSPCVATLITDFPPEVLRAVLNRFGDKFPYMFGGADGFIEPSDLIDAIVPQVATVPPKEPSELQLVPA